MLTPARIRAAKPGQRPYKLTDDRGLYLEVSPAGGRLWRLRYRHGDKDSRLALGKFPEVSLDMARAKAIAARALLERGVDPGAERARHKRDLAAQQALPTFGAVAKDWFALKSPTWAPSHSTRLWSRVEHDVLPWLGHLTLAEIDAPTVLALLRRIEERGAIDTARRVRGYIAEVFFFAIASGLALTNPAAGLVRALRTPNKGHMAAVTDPESLGRMLKLTDGYPGGFVVACALKLAPRLFVRPGELRHMKWTDVDLEGARWAFTASKTAVQMIVPLSVQVVTVLSELHGLTGRGVFVFPSARGGLRPMSDNAVLVAMRSMGIEKGVMTGHGFRATARTILDEVLHFAPEIIEQQLGHTVRDPLGRSYNRTTRLPERVAMMQRWADYLDEIKSADGNAVVKNVA